MSNQPDDGPGDVKERYAAQFAADLERNRAEQQQIREQVATLAERLALLESEEVLLADLSGRVSPPPASAPEQQTAATPEPTGPDADAPSDTSSGAVIPGSRQGRPSRSGAGRVKKVKATAATAGSGTVKGVETEETGKPTLRAAILQLLRQHREPRTAKEVMEEVTRAYPHLTPTGGVIRDALSAHVSKSLVERDKRQGAVWYSATSPEPAAEDDVSTQDTAELATAAV